MTSGRGIIAFAAVIFGNGIPLYVGAAGLLFGFSQAIASLLQMGSRFPPQFVLMAPYVLVVLALIATGQRHAILARLQLARRSTIAQYATTASPAPSEGATGRVVDTQEGQ